jgi:hypothetical protein
VEEKSHNVAQDVEEAKDNGSKAAIDLNEGYEVKLDVEETKDDDSKAAGMVNNDETERKTKDERELISIQIEHTMPESKRDGDQARSLCAPDGIWFPLHPSLSQVVRIGPGHAAEELC